MARIVTLTLNPALDLSCEADAMTPGHKMRVHDETHDPGGGGINVARVLHALGAETLAVALTGGVIGARVLELLAQQGVPTRAIPTAGSTRICTTIHERTTGAEYRLVPPGPTVTQAEFAACRAALQAEPADWLVLSGSLPPGLPADSYARLARDAAARGISVVLDTSGEPLRAALGAGLALIKPSLRELESLTGHPLPTEAEQDAAIADLLAKGAATRIAVSLGEAGAILAGPSGLRRRPAIPVQARGAVGAGDSFTAALTLALANGEPDDTALSWALAAGAAAVMQTGTAHPTRAAILALLPSGTAP